MNTIEELLDNGIDLYTAEMMISDYSKRVGTTNGIYKIVDINYDFNIRGKIVTLECQDRASKEHKGKVLAIIKFDDGKEYVKYASALF